MKIGYFCNSTNWEGKSYKQILNETFVFSSTYTVQDQYSETIKLENKSLENLINETYEDLLIKLIENI